jgi:glycosyltransferase involved in cell wall biosynthesis
MFAGTFTKVCERLKSAEYDLIDAHYVYPDGFAAILLGRAVKKPVVVSARGSDVNLFSRFPLIRPLLRQVFHRADGLIAVSQALKDKMVQLGCHNEDVAVVGNGVDALKFMPHSRLEMRRKLGLPSDRPILISVGQLNANKGFHVLIDSLTPLKSSGVLLLIIGEGHSRTHLEMQIREARLDSYVKLVGAIPHHQLAEWYSAADLFCLASSSEGCPNVVLEAMACGLPVVATGIGGIPELVVSSTFGTLVERKPEAFSSALDEALHKTWDHDAIATHARSHDWDKVSAQVMDVYCKALSQFHARA